MALGGGTFTTQNKVLPGAYFNVISAANSSATLGERGYVAMALELDWGKDGEIFEVTASDMQKNALKIFGYNYTHEKLREIRELFKSITSLYAYKLTSNGEKAKNKFATARYSGSRGNDLKVRIQKSIDDESKYDVSLYMENKKVDSQTVTASGQLKDNDFVIWDKSVEFEVVSSLPLAGGTNGEVNGEAHQDFLEKIESYTFNALGLVSTDDVVKSLYIAFTKRLRDEVGKKFQTVLYDNNADHEGVVNVKNKITDENASEASLVYWVTGVIASCDINASNTNKEYNGEFSVDVDYTQAQLEEAILQGEFVLHNVNGDVRVLADLNSFVSTTEEKGDLFKSNQTIRVIDQIANDITKIFATKYLGKVPNSIVGRSALKVDIVTYHKQLNDIRAIEGFSDADIVVEQGDTKKAVVVQETITVANSMEQLYMTVVIE